MKNHRSITARSLSAAALALAIGGTAVSAQTDQSRNRPSQSQSGWTSSDQQFNSGTTSRQNNQGQNIQVEIASSETSRRGIENLTGAQVQGVNGERVGTIKDFMIDPESGQVVFAVVSSGGRFGARETLRLVPFHAIRRGPDGRTFSTPVQQSNWNKLPAIAQQDFQRGLINITRDQQQQIDETSSGTGQVERREMTAADQMPGDFGRRYVRASMITGKAVRITGPQIGGVEDIVIDFDRGIATALIQPSSEFAGSRQSYLVPFDQLQIGTGNQETITTTLTRADFQRAQPSRERLSDTSTTDVDVNTSTQFGVSATAQQSDQQSGMAANQQGTSVQRTTTTRMEDREDRDVSITTDQEPLTPTGRTQEYQSQSGTVDPVLESAARSIRQRWNANPELAKANLQVTPENGRLVFRGSVPTADLWERAKDSAEAMVRGIEIQNLISIEQQ